MFRICLANPVGGADQSHPQRLGQDQLVAHLPGVVGVQVVGIHKSCDRQAVLDTAVCDGMPTGKDAPCLCHFFGTAPQDLTQNVQIHAFREADQIQCRLYLSPHGINIAQGVCRSDLSKGIGVLHHRREEIHRLHQCNILCNAVDRRIVPAVIAHQKIRVLFAPGELFQNMTQHACPQLGGAAAAGAEHDLFCLAHF